MSDDKLAERATAYIAKQRAQFTDGFSAIHTAHLRLQAALDVAIKERAEARAEVERLRGDRDKMLLNERDFVRKHRAEIERLTRERDEAQAEVERLREALSWYADLSNHLRAERRNPGDPDPAVVVLDEPPILRDSGTLARKALEGKP